MLGLCDTIIDLPHQQWFFLPNSRVPFLFSTQLIWREICVNNQKVRVPIHSRRASLYRFLHITRCEPHFSNPTVVPEKSTGPNWLKFGMENLFNIFFWLTEAIFEILPQTQFTRVVFSFFFIFTKSNFSCKSGLKFQK